MIFFLRVNGKTGICISLLKRQKKEKGYWKKQCSHSGEVQNNESKSTWVLVQFKIKFRHLAQLVLSLLAQEPFHPFCILMNNPNGSFSVAQIKFCLQNLTFLRCQIPMATLQVVLGFRMTIIQYSFYLQLYDQQMCKMHKQKSTLQL